MNAKLEGPETRYPPPGSDIPKSRRGLKNKPGCKHCRNAFQEEISLLTTHYCGYCDYGTYEISALNQHIQRDHPLDKSGWFIKCKLCEFSTVCKSNMKYHHKYVHDETNTFCCDYCLFSCDVRKDYYNHVIEEHAGPRLYKCLFCLYRNNIQAEVDRHMTALHPDQVNMSMA